MKKLISAILCTLVLMSGCSPTLENVTFEESSIQSNESYAESLNEVSRIVSGEVSNEVLSYGSTIYFDDLEIVFGDSVTWHTLDSEDVFAIPITVKNLRSDTHGLNMFSYKVYNPQGTKGETSANGLTYDLDNDINFMGDMQNGAQVEGLLYILYEGDGEYSIEFRKSISVIFNVIK